MALLTFRLASLCGVVTLVALMAAHYTQVEASIFVRSTVLQPGQENVHVKDTGVTKRHHHTVLNDAFGITDSMPNHKEHFADRLQKLKLLIQKHPKLLGKVYEEVQGLQLLSLGAKFAPEYYHTLYSYNTDECIEAKMDTPDIKMSNGCDENRQIFVECQMRKTDCFIEKGKSEVPCGKCGKPWAIKDEFVEDTGTSTEGGLGTAGFG
eukprot:GFYU01005207.1.p1 GENE.GFYU01005207.1~~GFYU01005207.1.p1  ORF type:complete len:237 (-),score=47.74 GFYU01005207.1:258-881(-)